MPSSTQPVARMRQEILAQVTMLAPSLALFRRVQVVHRAFHVTAQQQFAVRQRWRHVSVAHLRYNNIIYACELPNQKLDGLAVRYTDHYYRGYGCYINGNKTGEHRAYWARGTLDTKYMYVNGKRHGICWSWYLTSGDRTQLHQRITYEHGRSCAGVRFGIGGKHLVSW